MELILDTADARAIAEVCAVMNVAGVTTNPSIIVQSGLAPEEAIANIVEVLAPEQKLFVQTLAHTVEGIVEEGRRIAGLRESGVFAKVPVTHEGMEAIKELHAEGVGILATCIHTASQGMLAAMNGADYLAPYVNRMCNYGDGIAEVADLLDMLALNGMEAKVIAASIKNVRQVHDLMLAGVQAVTIPPAIAWQMLDHPASTAAVEEFDAAWQGAYGRTGLFE